MKPNWKKGMGVLLIMINIFGEIVFPTKETIYASSKNTESYKQIQTEKEAILQIKKYTGQSFAYPGCAYEYLTEEYILFTGQGAKFDKALKELAFRKDVVNIQPDYSYEMENTEEVLPNDTFANKQWWIKNDGTFSYRADDGTEIKAVAGVDCNVLEAWNSFYSTGEVIVAVIDTGVDTEHEDLKGVIWTNTGEIPGNGIDDDGNGYIDDVNGWDFYNDDNTVCAYGSTGKANSLDNDNHGTHCAGTIAAVAGNNLGVAGVASNVNVKIMPIKALGGANGATSTSKLVKGIQYAINNGADIVNASWGGSIHGEEDVALKQMIKRSGLLFVAAAGNSGENSADSPSYPASYNRELSNVVAVGALMCDGTLAKYSNYGQDVDILAPGDKIYGTTVGSYANMSGTSMAAPIVTGIAAMLYADKAYVYPSNVKSVLLSSYRQLDSISSLQVPRPGIIDAKMVVDRRNNIDTDLQNPSILELAASYNGTIKVSAIDNGNAGVCAILYAYGEHEISYFRRGAVGQLVTTDTVKVKKSGTYTFYVVDNAGNAIISRIYVKVDVQSPALRATKKKKKIIVFARDSGSGLDIVRYAYGKKSKEYFQNGNGTILNVNKNGKKTLKRKRKYLSLYAKDYAGNETGKIYKIK